MTDLIHRALSGRREMSLGSLCFKLGLRLRVPRGSWDSSAGSWSIFWNVQESASGDCRDVCSGRHTPLFALPPWARGRPDCLHPTASLNHHHIPPKLLLLAPLRGGNGGSERGSGCPRSYSWGTAQPGLKSGVSGSGAASWPQPMMMRPLGAPSLGQG